MSTSAVTLMEPARADGVSARRCASRFLRGVGVCRHKAMQRELVQALKGLGQIERDERRRRPAPSRGSGRHLPSTETRWSWRTRFGIWDILRPYGCRMFRRAVRGAHALPGVRVTAPLDLANAIRPLAILKEGAEEIEEAETAVGTRDLYAAAEARASTIARPDSSGWGANRPEPPLPTPAHSRYSSENLVHADPERTRVVSPAGILRRRRHAETTAGQAPDPRGRAGRWVCSHLREGTGAGRRVAD